MPSDIKIVNNSINPTMNISITQGGYKVLPEGPDGDWNQVASTVPYAGGGNSALPTEVAWIDRNQGITNGEMFYWNVMLPDVNGALLATCTIQLQGTVGSSDISIKASAANGAFDGAWVKDYNDSPKYSVTQNGVTYYVSYYLEANSLGYSNPTFWVWMDQSAGKN
jgi:hypothetical protein